MGFELAKSRPERHYDPARFNYSPQIYSPENEILRLHILFPFDTSSLGQSSGAREISNQEHTPITLRSNHADIFPNLYHLGTCQISLSNTPSGKKHRLHGRDCPRPPVWTYTNVTRFDTHSFFTPELWQFWKSLARAIASGRQIISKTFSFFLFQTALHHLNVGRESR